MKRMGLALAFCALLSLGSAQAQLAGGLMFPGPGTPHSAGGGGGASIVALVSGTNAGGASPLTVVSGQTFTTGEVVFGSVTGGTALTAAAINGVSATQIGTGITDGTTTVQMWRAPVTAGTGNITVSTAGAVGVVALAAWTITGALSGTPTANVSFNGFSPQIADPQGALPSLTVGSGGVGVVFIGGSFHVAPNPTVWAQATRDAGAETVIASGNHYEVAGAHISAAGTYTGITATGASGAGGTGSSSWDYSSMIGAAWQ